MMTMLLGCEKEELRISVPFERGEWTFNRSDRESNILSVSFLPDNKMSLHFDGTDKDGVPDFVYFGEYTTEPYRGFKHLLTYNFQGVEAQWAIWFDDSFMLVDILGRGQKINTIVFQRK